MDKDLQQHLKNIITRIEVLEGIINPAELKKEEPEPKQNTAEILNSQLNKHRLLNIIKHNRK